MRLTPILLLLPLLLAHVHCNSPSLSLRQAAPVVLSPQTRERRFSMEGVGKQLVARIRLEAPGRILVQSLSPGTIAWLTPDKGDRDPERKGLQADQPARFSRTDVRKYWYLFADVGDRPDQVHFISLAYQPAWHTIEEAHLHLQKAAQHPDADWRALYRSCEERLGELQMLRLDYRKWTADLEGKLRELKADLLLEQADALSRRGSHERSAASLEKVEDQLPALPAAAAARLRQKVQAVRRRNADGKFMTTFNTAGVDEMLDYCAPGGAPTSLETDLDDICHLLEMFKAEQFLHGAEADLMRHPPRAQVFLDSAEIYLGKHVGKLDPVGLEKAQSVFAQARRADLLAESAVLSKASLYARLRALVDIGRDTQGAIESFAAYRALADQAESAVHQGRHQTAVEHGHKALLQGRSTEVLWVDLGTRLPAAGAEERLRILRQDMTALQEKIAGWETYIRYRDHLGRWEADLERARRVPPDQAWDEYRKMGQLIAEIHQTISSSDVSQSLMLDLIERARQVQAHLGAAAVEIATAPETLAAADFDQLVAYHQLAVEVFSTGTELPPEISGEVRTAQLALMKRAMDKAEGRVDAALDQQHWEEADVWIGKVDARMPHLAQQLRLRQAVRQARHLRDQAQLDLERAYIADALDKYEEALALVQPYSADGTAREIRDFVTLEIGNLKSQNVALTRLETTLLPLAQCLGNNHPLPQKLPFNLIIRQGLVALPRARDDYFVRSYDIEVVMPREDYAKLTFKAMTTAKDREIPIEFTDLLDGKVSVILRTTSLREPPHVQLTFSGADIDLRDIGERWWIHKGVQL